MLTATRRTGPDGDVAVAGASPSVGRRWSGPGGVFGAGFAALLALLLVRNHVVFTEPVHPRGDSAANAIITAQAKHFDLLVGNYSRIGFSHPGPGFFYGQAAGEWLFHDLLGLVPAPWNGQWLAMLVLNAALVAAALAILSSWARSWPPVAWCGVAVLLFLATHDNLLSSAWMPYLYLAPFLLLLTAAASVAAGRTAHLWALALAGGLLVHGHAEFLLFVPVMAAAAVATAWPRRVRWPRRDLLPAGLVVALFALPIAVNLVWHWPGEFGKYLSYGGQHHAHGAAATARYVLAFWPGQPAVAAVLAVSLVAGLGWLAAAHPPGDRRSFLLSGLGIGVLATLLFVGYAARGIDDLSQEYVGYFSWAVPLFLLMLAVLAVDGARPARLSAWRSTLSAWLRSTRFGWLRPGPRVARLVPLGALAGALLVAGRSAALTTAPENLPDLPRVVGRLAQHASGRPVVVDLDRDAWPALTALIVEGDRTGLRVCARDPAWRFLVTAQFVCTGREVAEGWRVWLGDSPPATTLLGELDGVSISASA